MTAKFRMATMTTLCVLLALPHVALAKEAPRERARKHFASGASFYKAGAYRAAIREFQKADSLDPSPLLSFNMGICHEKLGEEEEAVRLFRVYLRRRPKARNKDKVEARIAALDASIEKNKMPAYELLEEEDAGSAAIAKTPAPAPPSGTTPTRSGVKPVNNARRLDPLLASRMPSASATAPIATGEAVPPGAEDPAPAATGPAEAAPAPAPQGTPPIAAGTVAPPVRDKPKKPVYKTALFWGVIAVSTAILISIAVKRNESSSSQALLLDTSMGNQGGAVLIRF